jgi:hypothetical protein
VGKVIGVLFTSSKTWRLENCRLKILAVGALAFLCLSFIIWLRKKPNLVEYELAGRKFLLDSRIKVMRAEDWGMGWTIRPGDWIPLDQT